MKPFLASPNLIASPPHPHVFLFGEKMAAMRLDISANLQKTVHELADVQGAATISILG